MKDEIKEVARYIEKTSAEREREGQGGGVIGAHDIRNIFVT